MTQTSFPAFLLLFILLSTLTRVHALWPQPRSLQTGSEALKLSPTFDIIVSGNIHFLPLDLREAISRTKEQVKNDRLGRVVVGRGSSDQPLLFQAKQLDALYLSFGEHATMSSIADEARKPLESRDEAYLLSVPCDGSPATLVANSSLGAFRGLATFTQLWYNFNGTTYALHLPVDIVDSPSYPYRGFMLDTARHYFPVIDIKRMLDAMSWVKLNQLHWHAVDSQSFPLQVPRFMDLAHKGAYSPDEVYTPDDIADIVSYAGARGIDVLIEIDTPGHTSVISKARAEHIACPEFMPWRTFANEPPAGQLRFASPATTNFTASLLEAVATMFPSTLFSPGGDELNTNCYDQDKETQSILSSTGQNLEQALDRFVRTTHQAVIDLGKTPVVWEEMVLVHNVTLHPETIALTWISSDSVKAVAQKGHRIIHAAADFFYLDCGGGGWIAPDLAGNGYCDPFKTWQHAYSFDPLANLTTEEATLVLGGEHLLWTEQSSSANLDPIVWPRAAASAELYWTGPGGNTSDALSRLHDLSFRLQKRGVNAIPIQPLWCALRPGACDLPTTSST